MSTCNAGFFPPRLRNVHFNYSNTLELLRNSPAYVGLCGKAGKVAKEQGVKDEDLPSIVAHTAVSYPDAGSAPIGEVAAVVAEAMQELGGSPAEVQENNDQLSDDEKKTFRALAARANYLSQDRPDIGFAVKEICRNMVNLIGNS